MHEFDDAPGEVEGFAFIGFAGLAAISLYGGATGIAIVEGVLAIFAVICAALHTAQAGEADRPKRGETRGSIHEHAVPKGDAP